MKTKFISVNSVKRLRAGFVILLGFSLAGTVRHAPAMPGNRPFNSIYCFGFSWTDTHGLSPTGTPTGPNNNTNYWHNRASNGPLWPELLSTNLGLSYFDANNYARGGASLTDTMNQVLTFRLPANPQLSLYCVMMGNTIDIGNEATWDPSIGSDILANSNLVSRLYARGARTIMVESQFDQDPSEQMFFGTNKAARARYRQAYIRLNSGFVDAMTTFTRSHPDVRVVFVDMFSKLDEVLANPVQFGFTKTDLGALQDTNLVDKSFAGPGADYLFWDEVHPTAKFHQLLAVCHLQALANFIPEKLHTLVSNGVLNIGLEHLQNGRDYTLEQTTDFQNWTNIQSFSAPAGTNNVAVSIQNVGGQYFRLRWAPAWSMVFIPPGSFVMGSPSDEIGRFPDEGPEHSVTLTRGFYLAKYPVTQEDYLSVTGSNPSFFNGDHRAQGGGNFEVDLNRPVENLSWEEATNYCGLLTVRDQAAGVIPAGSRYRLPTEAEWEYACRAGTWTRFYYGDDPGYTNLTRYAWYDANAESTGPHPVGQKLPNAWGFYDMLGNVLEYCQDWSGGYSSQNAVDPKGPEVGSAAASFEHVFRGGGWFFSPDRCRCASRNQSYPDADHGTIGFRVVLSSAP